MKRRLDDHKPKMKGEAETEQKAWKGTPNTNSSPKLNSNGSKSRLNAEKTKTDTANPELNSAPSNIVTITVSGPGESQIKYRVKPSTQIEKVRQSHGTSIGIPPSSLIFIHCGIRINNDTIAHHKIEDGDDIDAHEVQKWFSIGEKRSQAKMLQLLQKACY